MYALCLHIFYQMFAVVDVHEEHGKSSHIMLLRVRKSP